MKTHTHSLIAIFLSIGFFLCGLPAWASDTTPVNLSEARASIKAQGNNQTVTDYGAQFLASITKPLETAVKDGSAAVGESNFHVIFIVAADGHIKDAFLTDPAKQPLGKYVVTKLVGMQAAKPPKDHWAVFFLYGRP